MSEWDEDVAAGAAAEGIRTALRAVEDAGTALTDVVARAPESPALAAAGVRERIVNDVQPRLSEAWAALRGVEELAGNAMMAKEADDGRRDDVRL